MEKEYENQANTFAQAFEQLNQTTTTDQKQRQELSNLLVQIKEVLIYCKKYESFSKTTTKLTAIETKVRNALDDASPMSRKDCESKHDDAHELQSDIVSQCPQCKRRIVWMVFDPLSRFADVVQIKDAEEECGHCGQLIESTGSMGQQEFVVGIHVDDIWQSNKPQVKKCGLICHCCGGRKV